MCTEDIKTHILSFVIKQHTLITHVISLVVTGLRDLSSFKLNYAGSKRLATEI